MIKLIKKINSWFMIFGINPIKIYRSSRGLCRYFRDLRLFKRQAGGSYERFEFGKRRYCLNDAKVESVAGHYFYQDLYVAQRIFQANPKIHFDVGSRIDGFVAHVASFRLLHVMDVRLFPDLISNVTTYRVDLMEPLPNYFHECCDSLSCLHALEHFGLGRYGDPINYDGHLLGLENMYKMLKPGGKFYLSVPIGPQRIEFNAHRVFSMTYLLDMFNGKFEIVGFSHVDDKGEFHISSLACVDNMVIANNFGCNYGCGIFEMTKKDI